MRIAIIAKEGCNFCDQKVWKNSEFATYQILQRELTAVERLKALSLVSAQFVFLVLLLGAVRLPEPAKSPEPAWRPCPGI